MDKAEFEQKIKDMAHKATIEEIKEYWDTLVKTEEEHWGKDNIYSKWMRESREQALKDFKDGKPIEFYKDSMHFGYGTWGEDVEIYLYSDGTYKTVSYPA